jgi:hypothetical protein
MAHDSSAPRGRFADSFFARGRRNDMSDESGKPDDSQAPFTAQDAMAFMQKMWNPFAMPIPGAGAGAAMPVPVAGAGATAQSAAPNAIPGMVAGIMPGMLSFPNPAAMFAALDPAEVERKIGELRIIEGWLAMSLNLVQMSIRTLELQRAALETLRAGRAPAKAARSSKPRKGQAT